jgi:hypothetical protein
MTIGADDLALPDGVARAPEGCCPLVLVTLETDVGLGGLDAYRIVRTHYIVAGCARVTHGSMYTRSPIQLETTLMTLHANGGLLFRVKRIRVKFAFITEGDHQRRFLSRCIQVFTHGAVAGLTTTIGQRHAHLGHGKGLYVFFMALEALFAAFNKSRPFGIRVDGRPVNDAFIFRHRPCDT